MCTVDFNRGLLRGGVDNGTMGSFSVHFRTSPGIWRDGRLQELIWGVLGAHLGYPGRSFVVKLELIFPNSELICCSRHREVHGKSENVTL